MLLDQKLTNNYNLLKLNLLGWLLYKLSSLNLCFF